jgi:hypothetical protein
LIEHPIEAIWSFGLWPVSATLHRFVDLAARAFHLFHLRLVHASAILQLVFRIEDEEVRRAHRFVGARGVSSIT